MCCSTWIKKALNSGAESHTRCNILLKKRSYMRLWKFTRSNLLISFVTYHIWLGIHMLPYIPFHAVSSLSMLNIPWSLHAHACPKMSIARPSMFIHIHLLPIHAHLRPSIIYHSICITLGIPTKFLVKSLFKYIQQFGENTSIHQCFSTTLCYAKW